MDKKVRRLAAREEARKRGQRKKILSVVYIIGGLALLVVALLAFPDNKPAKASLDYSAEDVVYDNPLHAVHEMDGPSLASIPFLPEDQPQPKVAVSETYFDFGGVGATDVVTHQFIIQNVGEAPLTISRAYTTCGCTTADFTATVIPPGMVSVMTLTFDAGFHDAKGQTVRRGIFIENNDPNMPQLEIWTQAVVANN